jgi:uncharacterized protein YhaN
MRLRRLDLTRYGKFTGQGIDFGPAQAAAPDLHIVYGLNEAGKSTALSAYLDLLFGIENTSRYGFLHPYPSMQVGARLDFGGVEHELVRVKARVNSLLDGKNQPVNEALLSVPLAGLTRESYRSMFSLDDQSLEDGGNAIIASKGELGELLFAASAGLADLGAILSRVRDEADTIHKQRGRTTQIAELKRALSELKTEQDAIDTRASTHAALAAALKQAETAYAEAMHNRGLAKVRHEEVARILRAAPLAADYRRLSVESDALGELPDPPLDWAGQVSGLMIKNAELAAQIAGTQADIARLDEDIAALVVDEPVLAQGNAIAGLAEGMARFATAEADLPRRQAALAEDEAAITAILKGLGQDRDVAPDSLLLPASVVGTLRDLIEARSGIEAKAETARSELAHARDSLERAMRDLGDKAGKPAIDATQLDRVNAALGALRRSDHQARIRLAERAMPAVSRRYESLRDGLGRWSGDGDELRAVSLPEPRQLDRWRLSASTIDKRQSEQSDKLRELSASQREQSARIAAIRITAGAIDDAEAVRLRAARDAAWSAHAAALDTATAATFVTALQADDALGAARLGHVHDLAELRSLQQSLAVLEAGLLNGNEELAKLDAENAALAGEIRAAVDERIPLPKGSGVTLWLEQLESWMRQRQEVLTAWQALEETKDALASAKADLEHDLAILNEAMMLAGFDAVDELSPDALMQAAETALTQAGSQQATRAAREKNLRERESDVLLRERVLAEAMAAHEHWQQDWTEAIGQTWFTDSGVGAVRELLRLLADLPAALTQRNARARQIETMSRDQKEFSEQLQTILIALGEPLDHAHVMDAARALTNRRAVAEQTRRLRSDKIAERTRLAVILRELNQTMDIHGARKREMTAFFGVHTLEDVNARIGQAAERNRLRHQRDAVARQLTAELRTDSVEAALAQLDQTDLGETEREAAEMAARLEDLEAARAQRFAEHARAQERLDAIGGDDAVARIEARRRTVLLQIQDKAMDYLRLKTGALVAEKALHAYREQHRSSMMDRASQAFALITKGEYSGLAAQPEKDRETLIGLPRHGGSKLAADMSKGTQFQLYLALRLAGYQEFARSRPSVPFIADDIMETFDEPRSEQVFRLLGEMAHIGQVIYLTHHRHLCDIARAVVPTVTVHELAG